MPLIPTLTLHLFYPKEKKKRRKRTKCDQNKAINATITAITMGPKVMVRAEEEPELPGAGAGATSLDPEPAEGAAAAAPGDIAAAGESAGAPPAAFKAHLLTEGAETRQAAGRAKALVTLRVTPSWALFLKASQRQSASVLSTVLSPEQQEPSGFCAVLPLVTKDKQSAMFKTRLEQSAAGAGAVCPATDSPTLATTTRQTKKALMAVSGITIVMAILYLFLLPSLKEPKRKPHRL